MKPYGHIRHGRTLGPDHQECGACHPPTKNGRTKARTVAKKEVQDGSQDLQADRQVEPNLA